MKLIWEHIFKAVKGPRMATKNVRKSARLLNAFIHFL